jgi:subtilase family serine protease
MAIKLWTGVLASAAMLAIGAATASAATALVKVGSTPVIPHGARVLGSEPSTSKLNLTIALQPQDPAGLQALATEVSTPGTPLFRHYLSVSQFAQQFGATPLQIAAVESTLRAQGLSVGTVTANNLTLPVTGTAAQVQKAFSVSESQVQLPSGRIAYANAQAPTLQSNIAHYVQGVIGLDNVNPDQPAGLATQSQTSPHGLLHAAARPHVLTNGGPQPCSSAAALTTGNPGNTSGMNGVTADEVATAYQFSGLYGAGDLGQGQTIALFEEQPYIASDIATYQGCYETSASVSNVDVAGGPGTSGDDGESALDIEQVIGLAPKANILVYQGPFTATVQIISAIVSQNLAKVISSSYGLCEALTGGPTITAETPLLQEAAVQGQSFFISSGDSGSNMCYQATADQPTPDLSLSVIDPGGQPFATGVGGTSLIAGTPSNESFYQAGLTPLETVWNDPSSTDSAGRPHLSGTGGGISSQFTMPSYQSSAAGPLNVINSNSSAAPCSGSTFCREVPDVAADADPNTGYAVFSSTGGQASWGVTGGTSAAAPLWAAFTALANASGTCRGLPVGFVNPALYQLASTSYLNNFNDITTASPNAPGFSGQANNDAAFEFPIPNNPNDLFPIGTGYDMATGLGSMIAPHLAASLCSLRAPVYTVSVAFPGNQLSIVNQAAALQVSGADSGGAALSYSAAGLPPGLAINPANGLITGTPTVSGSYAVTVAAGDAFTNGSQTGFTWTVVTPQPPTIAGGSLGNVAKGRAKLSFKLTAGAFEPPIQSFSFSLPGGVSFAKKARTLGKGIVLKGTNGQRARYSLKLSHGVLTITLRSTQTALFFSIAPPATSVSSSLAKKVKHHKVKTLSVLVNVVNSSRATTRLPLKLKV